MKVFAAGLSLAVQGFPALPHVETELQAIKQLYGSEPLLNQQFVVPALEHALQASPFSIVHLASHAQFAGEADETFVLTFDGRLSLDHLDQFIGLFRFHDTPLELLTLSACETAAGDDRAALGLAGVAIKAGARSVLATLWAVHDQAAAALVSEFYTHLQRSSVSRAQALRSAQTRLLADQRYQHPAYWSAFLLLNNWL